MAVTKRLRYEILRRDNFTCRYCGAKPPETELKVDHVMPRALGGADAPENLVAACHDCNAGKSSVRPDDPMVAQVAEDALRWATAMKYARIQRGHDRSGGERMAYAFEEDWLRYRDNYGDPVPMDDFWPETIATFYDCGLNDINDYDPLIRAAMAKTYVRPKDKWAYFCGCAWKEIRARQELAREALGDDSKRLLLDAVADGDVVDNESLDEWHEIDQAFNDAHGAGG